MTMLPKKYRRKRKRPIGIVGGKIQDHHDNIVYDCLDWVKVNHQEINTLHIPEAIYSMCGYNSGVDIRIKEMISEYLKGVPDIILIYNDHVLVGDVKTGAGKLSKGQKKWNPFVWHNFKEFKKDFEKWFDTIPDMDKAKYVRPLDSCVKNFAF